MRRHGPGSGGEGRPFFCQARQEIGCERLEETMIACLLPGPHPRPYPRTVFHLFLGGAGCQGYHERLSRALYLARAVPPRRQLTNRWLARAGVQSLQRQARASVQQLRTLRLPVVGISSAIPGEPRHTVGSERRKCLAGRGIGTIRSATTTPQVTYYIAASLQSPSETRTVEFALAVFSTRLPEG